jgi:hypothetical protein
MPFLTGRGKRREGKRRPLRASVWGWLVTISGGAITLFFTWQLIFPTIVPRNEGWKAWLAAAAITLTCRQHWFAIVRRSEESPEVIPARPDSVLYLRAFDEEKRPFAFGPRSALKDYTTQFIAHAPMQSGDPTVRLTLDDYLEEVITAQFGPFVALGNPFDKLVPDGAVREYAPDDRWQARFLELAQAAKCIVVSIGGSANLEWELNQVCELGMRQKLCLFTSPIVPGTDQKILNRLRRTAKKRSEALDADWARSTDVLRRAGFNCGANPGPGAAVTFDEDGNSILLATDATAPEEFIAPVAEWFKLGQKSGRCVPVACRTCGASTHVTPTAAAEGGECYACRQKAQDTPTSVLERHSGIVGLWVFFSLLLTVGFCQQVLETESSWMIVPLWIVVAALPIAPILVVRRVRGRYSDQSQAR